MRVIVCGSRDWTDEHFVRATLNRMREEWGLNPVVIQGGARGVDRFAKRWAERLWILVEQFDADWTRYGRSAGPIRNARMLAEGRPDLVVAFPGGSGTADMVRQARAAGVKVIEVK